MGEEKLNGYVFAVLCQTLHKTWPEPGSLQCALHLTIWSNPLVLEYEQVLQRDHRAL